MSRRCTICTSEHRDLIDVALVAGTPSLRNIAERYGTSTTALHRHKGHLPQKLVKAKEAQEVVAADDLLAQVSTLQKAALSILSKAYQAGNLQAALGGIREARECVKLQAAMVAVAMLAEREREARMAPGSQDAVRIYLPDNGRGDRYPTVNDEERSDEPIQSHYPHTDSETAD